MDYKEANEKIAIHNIRCGDRKDFKKVYAWDIEDQKKIKVCPIKFYEGGTLITVEGLWYDRWKLIEEETPKEMSVVDFCNLKNSKLVKPTDAQIDEKETEDAIIAECPCCGQEHSSKSIINSWKESPSEPQTENENIVKTKTPMKELFIKYGHLLPDIESEYLQKELDYKSNPIIHEAMQKSEADTLRRAKEICFKTGYVRNKLWCDKTSFATVESGNGKQFYVVYHLSKGSPVIVEDIGYKQIFEEWESVDPREI